MKKVLLYLFFFLINICFAQKELWGVNSGYQGDSSPPPFGYPPYFGNIIKYDSNGNNPEIIHEFDQTNGKSPLGRLFLASNGKLYGTCSQGGLTTPTIQEGYGVLFEYDLVLNKFRVVKYLDSYFNHKPYIGFIEPIVGKLYSAASGKLMIYDIVTETTSFYGQINYVINSELIKGSDGNLYGTGIFEAQNCPNSSASSPPYNGSIIKINTTTNTINNIYFLDCNWAFGAKPTGELIEMSPGKLYGTTDQGGLSQGGNISDNYGVIFEYNFLTNTYTKKFDFNNSVTGSRPNTLVKGSNGNLYGVCIGGNICTASMTLGAGTLFEFNPLTNIFNVLKNFGCGGNLIAYPKSLLKTSTGDLFGTMNQYNGGIYKYDPINNLISIPTSSNPNFNAYNTSNLIEICRKPFYNEFIPNTYNPCVNTPFTYNIQNTNATSYIWKKDGVIVPLQTTGILTINNLIASDTGVYTCTMTNECGTTTTMNLNVNVNCLDNETFVNDKNEIVLYPNPTKNTISIHLPENETYEIKEIAIANMLGQNVISDIINIKNINVSSLQKGIYILQLKTNKGNWNGKFVKE